MSEGAMATTISGNAEQASQGAMNAAGHVAMSAAASLSMNNAMSPTQLTLRHLYRDKVALTALLLLLAFALLALLAPLLAPYDPYATAPEVSLAAPGAAHWMGTDLLGRDVFSRILFGARISLLVGLVSVSISAAIGVLLGLLAGYYGRWVDTLIMRCIDVLMAFPGMLLALAIVALLGPGIGNVMIAVGIGGIANYARLVRSSVLSIKEELYVEAARSVGAIDARVMGRHILPNALPPVLVLASMSYGWALLSSAGLSFLGLGAEAPAAEWGAMLSDGRALLWDAPWLAIFPGLAIMLVVLAANLLGDALRDALDPRLRL
jgi:ABC-type dipeptide/oligopeptide/nickel transport system permease subunit